MKNKSHMKKAVAPKKKGYATGGVVTGGGPGKPAKTSSNAGRPMAKPAAAPKPISNAGRPIPKGPKTMVPNAHKPFVKKGK